MCGSHLRRFECGHYEIKSVTLCSAAPECSMKIFEGRPEVGSSYDPPSPSATATDASLFSYVTQTAREFLLSPVDRPGEIDVEHRNARCNHCLGHHPPSQSSAMSTGPCLAVKHYFQCGCQPRGDPTNPWQFLCDCKGDFHGFAQGLLIPLAGTCELLMCPDCGCGSYCGGETVLPRAEIVPLIFRRDSTGTSYAPYGRHGRIEKDSRKDFDSTIHVV